MNQKTPNLKTFFPALFLAAGFAGILVAGLLVMGNEELFLLINREITPRFGQIARLFSLLGESWAMGFLLLLSLRMPAKNTLLLALTWLSGAIHSWIFKLWLCKGWPRPFAYFSEKGIGLQLVDGVKVHSWNSFPSGHTITAFSLLILLPVLFPKLRFRYLLSAGILAYGCGISRIVLVQHWPADVLGGIVLGCSASLVAYFLSRKFLISDFLHPSVLERTKFMRR